MSPTTATPANARSTLESFEKELLRELRFGGLEKENLSELVSVIVDWQREGLRGIKVFPIGIPAPDGLSVRGILDQKSLSVLLQKILVETPRLTGVRVFPYGIPFPELFEVGVELGSVRQTPGHVSAGQF